MTYINFEKYILRVPLLPQTTTNNITRDKLKEVFSLKFVQEAIFLASPELYETTQKYLSNQLVNKAEIEKLENTLLKYLSRMSHRCTPFGLFAGCSVGEWNETTDISLKEISKYSRHTRLDMNYLCSLSLDLNKDVALRKELLYQPNSTIYSVGNQYRYVEFRYNENIRRHYIVAIDKSDYLTKILDVAGKRASVSELAYTITDHEISFEDASLFVNELIDNQILVSDIEPNVTGDEYLSILIQKCSCIPSVHEGLKSIENLLYKIDSSTFGESLNYYEEIEKSLDTLNGKVNRKFLFQTDQVVISEKNQIDKSVINQVWDGIKVLNNITGSSKSSNLKRFIKAFAERYEDQEVPLIHALDVDFGIAYLQNGFEGERDESELLDDLILPINYSNSETFELNRYQKFLYKKLLDVRLNQKNEIVIEEADINDFKKSEISLPPTFSVIIELLSDTNNQNLIRLTSVGGSSASNLVGRFSHADEDIQKYVQEISNKENELLSDFLIAEIAHLPESRVGNILLRPITRNYEIPYLANSTLEKENQIKIDDLMISVINDMIILRSKRLNKIIIPRLSTAHNYSWNSQPIYHFLCDLQMQDTNEYLMLDWGKIQEMHYYLPRVRYKNIILSPASWVLNDKKINELSPVSDEKDIDIIKCEQWRKKYKIPSEILLIDGDNELYIDLDNPLYVRMFLDILSKHKQVKLQEYLFISDNNCVRKGNTYFTNQVICSFYKQ